MIRLHLVVEGQTEETFVNRVLAPALGAEDIFIDTHCVTTGRKMGLVYRGGIRSYLQIKRDLELWMKQDRRPESCFSTMIDLYGLGRLKDAFPGWDTARRMSTPDDRVTALETAFETDIAHQRFIPYIQLHEFEALLFADPRKLDWAFIDHDSAIDALEELSRQEQPEEIDEGEETAPSKRIIAEIPEYESEKVSAGPLVAEKIGLDKLEERCPHFRDWIRKLRTCAGRSDGE